jgi:molybdopterin converting factor small subunit
MKVRVQLFAVAKEVARADAVTLDLAPAATVADLKKALVAKVRGLAPVLEHSAIAIDAEYAADEATIAAGADVAVIPPVSGG